MDREITDGKITRGMVCFILYALISVREEFTKSAGLVEFHHDSCSKDRVLTQWTVRKQIDRLMYVRLCLTTLYKLLSTLDPNKANLDIYMQGYDTPDEIGMFVLNGLATGTLPVRLNDNLKNLKHFFNSLQRNKECNTPDSHMDVRYKTYARKDKGLHQLMRDILNQCHYCTERYQNKYETEFKQISEFLEKLQVPPSDTSWCTPCQTMFLNLLECFGQDIENCHRRMLASLTITINRLPQERKAIRTLSQILSQLEGFMEEIQNERIVEILFLSGTNESISNKIVALNQETNRTVLSFVINDEYRFTGKTDASTCCEPQVLQYFIIKQKILRQIHQQYPHSTVTVSLLTEQSPCPPCEEDVMPELDNFFKTNFRNWTFEKEFIMKFKKQRKCGPDMLMRLWKPCRLNFRAEQLQELHQIKDKGVLCPQCTGKDEHVASMMLPIYLWRKVAGRPIREGQRHGDRNQKPFPIWDTCHKVLTFPFTYANASNLADFAKSIVIELKAVAPTTESQLEEIPWRLPVFPDMHGGPSSHRYHTTEDFLEDCHVM